MPARRRRLACRPSSGERCADGSGLANPTSMHHPSDRTARPPGKTVPSVSKFLIVVKTKLTQILTAVHPHHHQVRAETFGLKGKCNLGYLIDTQVRTSFASKICKGSMWISPHGISSQQHLKSYAVSWVVGWGFMLLTCCGKHLC